MYNLISVTFARNRKRIHNILCNVWVRRGLTRCLSLGSPYTVTSLYSHIVPMWISRASTVWYCYYAVVSCTYTMGKTTIQSVRSTIYSLIVKRNLIKSRPGLVYLSSTNRNVTCSLFVHCVNANHLCRNKTV